MLPTAFTGWKKFHSDNTVTNGNDYDVDKGRASWSRSRLDNVRSVSLKSINSDRNPVSAYIYSQHTGLFHQSDDYIAPILRTGTVKGTRIVRRIQRQLGEQDYSFMVNRKLSNLLIKDPDLQHDMFIYVYSKEDAPLAISNSSEYHNVYPGNLGKWITIEISNEPNDVKWYLSDSRI